MAVVRKTREGDARIKHSSQVWASINHVIPVLGSRKQHSELRDYPSLASSPTAACSKLRSQSDPAYHLFPGLLRPRAHLLYCTMRPLYSTFTHASASPGSLIAMHLPWRLHSYGLPTSFLGPIPRYGKLRRARSAQTACGQRINEIPTEHDIKSSMSQG